MGTQIRDLWPSDIGVATLVTPVSILREQAALLGEKTGNLVQAEVKTSSNGQIVTHSFNLVAPAMGNYRYRLLSATHNVEVYPLTLNFDPTNSGMTVKTEQEFIEKLSNFLSSEKAVNIVKSLIAQSQQ